MGIIRNIYILLFFIIIFLFCSCVTYRPIHGYPIAPKELETIDILGLVETEFEATRPSKEETLLQQGYNQLLIIAKKQYTGDIDVKDIFLEVRSSTRNLWYLVERAMSWHYTTVHAKGLVIKNKEVDK